MSFPTAGLSNEKKAALSVLESSISNFTSLVREPAGLDVSIISTEGMIFSSFGILDIAHLPKGDWNWNQSRTRVELNDLSGTHALLFYKLNTRKKKQQSGMKLVLLKIWIYNLTHIKSGVKTSFFWCEKGIQRPMLDDALLEDLSFLSQYMEPSVADELGWGDNRDQTPKR